MSEFQLSYLTLSELTSIIQYQLENEPRLNHVTVRGEVAQISERNGHYYLTLKDHSNTQLKVVLFRSFASKVSEIPHMGDDILVYGDITVYPSSGQYQLLAKDLLLTGLGAQLIALEKLKKKLDKEGLFSKEHKLQIPKFPKKIGIITALNGAAIQDIVKNIIQRYPLVELEFYPSGVQGEHAVVELLHSLKKASTSDCDVLIIGRGGGGKEDLMAFNDETLVREIYACSIPIISAVGHEVDRTLVDYVADLSVSTPTEAAVKATPNQFEIMQYLDDLESRIEKYFSLSLIHKKEKLISYKRSIQSPLHILEGKSQILTQYMIRLQNHLYNRIEEKNNLVKKDLLLLEQNQLKRLENIDKELLHKRTILDKINPYHWLEKGYVMTMDEKGNVITSTKDLKQNDRIVLRYLDGEVETVVERITHGRKENI